MKSEEENFCNTLIGGSRRQEVRLANPFCVCPIVFTRTAKKYRTGNYLDIRHSLENEQCAKLSRLHN
jgi:hypothetical protein